MTELGIVRDIITAILGVIIILGVGILVFLTLRVSLLRLSVTVDAHINILLVELLLRIREDGF
jgi:hypothetical protein